MIGLDRVGKKKKNQQHWSQLNEVWRATVSHTWKKEEKCAFNHKNRKEDEAIPKLTPDLLWSFRGATALDI